jgi:hypothetical protein
MIETIILSAAAGFIPGALVGGFVMLRVMEKAVKELVQGLAEGGCRGREA